MTLYYPDMHVQGGDVLYAESNKGWGHISDGVSAINDGEAVTIQFDSRASDPLARSDEYHVQVNGTWMNLHVDYIGDIFAHADHLSYDRGE